MFGTEGVAAENRDYQQRLAASLVGTMGMERAVETCLSNGWDGVHRDGRGPIGIPELRVDEAGRRRLGA